MSWLARFGLLFLVSVLAWLQSTLAADESAKLPEQRLKAAFLFKFGGYVEWPASAFPGPDSPFMIGVAGADPLADELSKVIAGRTMNGRTVAVKRIRGGEQISGLHVLFIGGSQGSRLGELLTLTQSLPVLTVTETDNGLAQGSIINFVVADNRVRFEVSVTAASRGGLRIGAPLLAVAQRVWGDVQ
jgi:hypothetical protein